MNFANELAKDRAAALKLVRVSHETESRLDLFVNLFLRWQSAVQLVAKSTLAKLWTRHIADSLQLVDIAPDARTWVDFGSGGGFPGLMIAIAIADRSGVLVHLIESDTRKAAFLREAARVTRAPVQIHADRIESVAERIGRVDVVVARALSPLTGCLQHAAPFLAAGSTGIFLKGQDVDKELTEAAKSWMIQWTMRQSLTDPGGKIVIINSANPRPVTKC